VDKQVDHPTSCQYLYSDEKIVSKDVISDSYYLLRYYQGHHRVIEALEEELEKRPA
jgi:hypothetical protein